MFGVSLTGVLEPLDPPKLLPFKSPITVNYYQTKIDKLVLNLSFNQQVPCVVLKIFIITRSLMSELRNKLPNVSVNGYPPLISENYTHRKTTEYFNLIQITTVHVKVGAPNISLIV